MHDSIKTISLKCLVFHFNTQLLLANERLTGLVTFCVETAFYKRLFKKKVVIEVTGRRGRKCRKLLDDLKERRGYCHLKEEALDGTMWRTRFGKGFEPVVRQTTKRMK
jgi:hypothetical protein